MIGDHELVHAVPLGALSALRADLSTKCSAGLAPTQRPRVYIPAHLLEVFENERTCL
jgi:hypothetical protein